MNSSNLKRMVTMALFLLAAPFLPGYSAFAQDANPPGSNAIEQIEFSQISGQTLIKLTLRNPLLHTPEPYTLYSPQPRIFYDFLDTENATGITQKQAALTDLQSLNLIQAGSRTRLVLNLNKSAQQSSRLDGKVLMISLSAAAGHAASPKEATTKSATPALSSLAGMGSANAMQNVEFRAESADLATLRIDVSDPNPIIDVKRQGSSLVLVLPQVALPDRLARRLDVRDFGTPMINATTSKAGQGSQLIIANRGDWDYSVTQLDTSVRIEVRRIIQDPNSLAGSKELQGKTISFNFTQPVPVSQMMGIFQDITGLNFVMMPGVTGEIERLKMDNTSVETAINVVSRMYGLSMRRYGEVVVVGKAADLAKYEKEDRDLQAARADSEPIEQEAIKVRFRPAAEVVAALTGTAASSSSSSSGVPSSGAYPPGATPTTGTAASGASATGKSLISARGSISSDPVTNMIFVEETKSQLNKIRERIVALDLPIRQVMIEARIVSVSSTFLNSLGVRLGYLKINPRSVIRPKGTTLTGSTPLPITLSTAINNFNTPFTADGTASGIAFSLFNPEQTRFLNMELSASESDGISKSIASPKILTQDGRQATITDGQTLYYQLSGGTSGPTTVAVDASTKLDVTPQINSDGKVALKVDVNKGGVGTVTTSAGPSVTKQQVITNVVVENGGTLMLGGVFTEQDSDSVERVPFLGDLPYVGFLFKQKTKTRNRNELLIFLTPRIVTEELALQ